MPTKTIVRTTRPEHKSPVAALAVVHHANQYLISNGYIDRCGIHSVAGSNSSKRGIAYILELHRKYRIPANIHLSGTLLESLAWFEPRILTILREMNRDGLLEIIGSTYSQNIMRFFTRDYNLKELNEELTLYELHLGIQPSQIKSFWPPERIWDTPVMAPVIRDPALRNGGFDFVFMDDRVLLPASGKVSPRSLYDSNPKWDPKLLHAYRILDGQGLIALPIATSLRRCIPPRAPEQQREVENQLRWVSSLDPTCYPADFLAVYGDDMEKAAGVGWDSEGPSQFEQLLLWLSRTGWVKPVKVSEWASAARIADAIEIQGGTYAELAQQFGAGELYENWYFDRRWVPYRDYFAWSQKRVEHLNSLGADTGLIELAQKHLLASSWETAWHTPVDGAHSDVNSDGGPSGSSRAAASHSRHAAMIAEAAYWQAHKDGESHCLVRDLDNDGEEEVVVENRNMFAVISPRRGARLIALFAVDGINGKMVVGNPCDDWNLKEELNDYMDVPPNHPGALADVGFEHDSYVIERVIADSGGLSVRLRNAQTESLAFGLVKEFSVSSYQDHTLRVQYSLPAALHSLRVEFGLSPDYLELLRRGRSILKPHRRKGTRGWRTDSVAVWVKPVDCLDFRWTRPYQKDFGHGCALRLLFESKRFCVVIGLERVLQANRAETLSATHVQESA